MSDPEALYDTDYAAWSEEQAAALRAAARTGSNRHLDWENLAEEIGELGKSVRAALRSQIRRIVRHLVKLEFSLATDPRRGWRTTLTEARQEVHDLLHDSPSLKSELGRHIAEQTEPGIKLAISDLEEHRELGRPPLTAVRAARYSEDQVLGDWYPDPPPER